MAATTQSQPALTALPPASGRAGFGGTLASEFTKIRSVRSTYWTLLVLLVVSIGIGAAITGGTAANWSHMAPSDRLSFDPTQASVAGLFYLGQLVIVVFGAMTLTAEYSTGMIRTSLTAQPRRGTVYAAKAIVLTSLTLIVSLVTSFIAFFVGQALLSSSGVSASLFHSVTIPQNANVTCPQQGAGGGGGGLPPGCKVVFSGTDVISPTTVLLAIIGCVLFVTLVAIIAFGIGAIVRHTAGAIAIAIAALFIIPVLEQALPHEWRWDIMRFLPDAANQVVSVTIGSNANAHLWSAWPQLGVTALWAAALLAAGAYLFRKRDA